MTDLISTDSPFTEAQKNTLFMLAGLMIPAEGVMPSANDAEIFSAILEGLTNEDSTTLHFLDAVTRISANSFNRAPEQLDDEEKMKLVDEMQVNEPELIGFFQFHTINNYYQDDRVMNALGMEARPPHPGGYTLEPTDWSLLDPVRERKEIYRKV